MARGGYRPGAGRKPGSAKKTPVKSAGVPFVTKAGELAVFYKGMLDRAAQGKKPTAAETQEMSRLAAELAKTYETGGEDKGATSEDMLPLDYMLKVMNDPRESKDRRDRLAIAAAPFCHTRKGEGSGKKEEKIDKAKSAGAGRFAAGIPPLKLVNKK